MKTKKIISVFLAVLMAFSALSVSAFAATTKTPEAYVASYKPIDASKSSTTASDLPVILNTVLSALGQGKLNTVVSKVLDTGFITNATLGNLLKGIQDFAGDSNELFALAFSPAGILSGLASNDAAAAATAKAMAKLNTGMNNGNTWDAVPAFVSGDFGFNDGDIDGFILAFARSLLVLKTNSIDLDEQAQQLIGAPAIGADYILGFYWDPSHPYYGTYLPHNTYDYLVKLYGILGLEAMSTADFLAAHNGDMITAVTTALAPVAKLVKDLKKDPLDTVLGILPSAAYLLNSGVLNETVNTLFKEPFFLGGALADKEFDLTTAGVYAKIKDVEIAGSTFGDYMDQKSFTYLMEDIESCGTASVGKDANGNDIVVIKANKDAVAVTIGNKLLGMLGNGDVRDLITEALKKQGINSGAISIVSALMRVFPAIGTETIVKFAKFFTRVLSIFSIFTKFFEKINKL